MDFKIVNSLPNDLSDVFIKNTLSKHILFEGDVEHRYETICMEEGHPHVRWGMGMGNTDIDFQRDYIKTMLKEKHMYPVRFLVVRHPDTGRRCVWCDNMHHTLMQCKILEKDFGSIKIRDMLSYYVVDISNDKPVIYDPDYHVRQDEIHNVIEKSYVKTWFRSSPILDFGYTMGIFIERNKDWYESI